MTNRNYTFSEKMIGSFLDLSCSPSCNLWIEVGNIWISRLADCNSSKSHSGIVRVKDQVISKEEITLASLAFSAISLLKTLLLLVISSSHGDVPISPALPSAMPAVSGRYCVNTDVIALIKNMTRPIVRNEVSLDIIYGHEIPPSLPSALALNMDKGKPREEQGT